MGKSRIIIKTREKECVIDLDDKSKWLFGRNAGDWKADISVDVAAVSRVHGEFCCINGVWIYFDRKSTNGTYINGKKLKLGLGQTIRPHVLENGDIIIVSTSEPTGITVDDVGNDGVWIKYIEDDNLD